MVITDWKELLDDNLEDDCPLMRVILVDNLKPHFEEAGRKVDNSEVIRQIEAILKANIKLNE